MYIDELTREERELVIGYRRTDDITRRNVRIILDLPVKKQQRRKVLPFIAKNGQAVKQ